MQRLRIVGFFALAAVWFCAAIAAMLHHSVPTQARWSDAPPAVHDNHADTPFVLILNDWASQSVFSHVVGQLIESRGRAVQYVQSDTVLQFDLLAKGDAHFQVAVWHNRMAALLDTAADSGAVSVGEHALRFRDGWWVSDATLEACPAAADWAGFTACANEPGTDEQGSPRGGRFVAPPMAFQRDYLDLVSRLGMPVEHEYVADLVGLQAAWAAADAGEQGDSGILEAVYNWSPNSVPGPVNGQFMTFPPPDMACFRDPDWGPNPDVVGDCGDPPYFAVSKAAWAGALDVFPDVWPILQAVDFDSTDYRQVVDWMSEPGSTAPAVASRWIAANTGRADQWRGQPL